MSDDYQKALRILSNKRAAPVDSDIPEIPQSTSPEDDYQKAMNIFRGYEEGPEPEPTLSTMEKAGQVARGIPATYGAIGDLISSFGHAVSRPFVGGLSQSSIFQDPENPVSEREAIEQYDKSRSGKRPLSEVLPEQTIDRLYGKSLAPTDAGGRFRQGIGEFLTPIPGGGLISKAAKAGIKPLLGQLGREAATATGASAGAHLTPRLTEEGTIPGTAEDLLKTMAGGVTGGTLAGAVPGVSRMIAKKPPAMILEEPKVKKPLLAKLEDIAASGLGKATSLIVKPKKEIIDLGKKLDVEIPFNVGNVGFGRGALNSVANNYMKSMFVSSRYNDVMKRADDSMINAVKKSIDSLGTKNLKPREVSEEATNFLRRERKEMADQVDVLYQEERKAANRSDKIIPKNTIDLLKSERIQDLMKLISPAAGQKIVQSKINDVKKAFFPEKAFKLGKGYEGVGEKALESIIKSSEKHAQVPVRELIDLKSSLMNTLGYEKDVVGSEATLYKFIDSLDKDIKYYKNPEFQKKHEIATSFFRTNIGQRFRNDIAQSLVNKTAPKEAFNLMSSVENINTLERIAGKSTQGKEIFDSLKKAKVREIIGTAVEGDLYGEGHLKTGMFSTLFKSTGKEKKQDLLYRLLGNREYDKLHDIAKISDQFSKDNKHLLNTSSTAHVASDMKLTGKMARESIYIVSSIFGGYKLDQALLGFGAAAGLAGIPYVMSRLLSNPNFTTNMRGYAVARQAGRDRYADNIMKKMLVTVVNETDEAKRKNPKSEEFTEE